MTRPRLALLPAIALWLSASSVRRRPMLAASAEAAPMAAAFTAVPCVAAAFTAPGMARAR